MKKINLPKIIWISSIFIILIIILLLVMNYKINYEYLIHNYLYFYECNTNLCVSQVEEDDKLIFSKYDCGFDECPQYLKSVDNDYVILTKDNKNILYNYRNSKIISDEYSDYYIINNNYVIIKFNGKKGILSLDNKILLAAIYDEIGYEKDGKLVGYNLNNIIVKKDNLYGIVSYKDGKIIEEIKHNEDEIDKLLEKIKNSD